MSEYTDSLNFKLDRDNLCELPTNVINDTNEIINDYRDNHEASIETEMWSDSRANEFKELIKEDLENKQNDLCAYCRLPQNSWQIEHIVPKSRDRSQMFSPGNLCLSCGSCNSSKNDFSGEIVNPYEDDYFEHIELRNDVLPIPKNQSSKGLNTIEHCKLASFEKIIQHSKLAIKYRSDDYSQLLLFLVDPTTSTQLIDEIVRNNGFTKKRVHYYNGDEKIKFLSELETEVKEKIINRINYLKGSGN